MAIQFVIFLRKTTVYSFTALPRRVFSIPVSEAMYSWVSQWTTVLALVITVRSSDFQDPVIQKKLIWPVSRRPHHLQPVFSPSGQSSRSNDVVSVKDPFCLRAS